MKLISVMVVLVGTISNSYCQKVISSQILKTPVVVLYENTNFEGRSMELGESQYRLSDINDIVSSIKIPSGFCAILYEHADAGGGYGRSVDLLEDCVDLGKYDFNDITSFVSVFNPKRSDGLIWIRNSMQKSRFIAGHWERERAGGTPVNSVAVVSPPLPPHNAGITTLQVNGAVTTITTLAVQTSPDQSYWQTAVNDQSGVIGNDFRGVEEIGNACFERASNNRAIPDFVNFWYPQKQPRDHRAVVFYKRTLSGTLKHTEIAEIDGTYEDHDVNMDIVPFPKYQYLITEGHPYEYTNIMQIEYDATLHQLGKADCDHEDRSVVESEIDSDPAVRNIIHNSVKELPERALCVYGVWLYDNGHCAHPEIHPAEQIWWNDAQGNGKKYFFSVICDNSKRFWWRNQMDDGTKLKPWGAPPTKGLFAIAFEAIIGQPKKFEVSNISHNNVIEFPDANKTYDLVYQNNVLASFIPHNNAFKVSYENVGLVEGTTNKVRGFLVIETSVGTCTQISTSIPPNTDPNSVNQDDEQKYFQKLAGHYLFNISEKVSSANPVRVIGARPLIRQ